MYEDSWKWPTPRLLRMSSSCFQCEKTLNTLNQHGAPLEPSSTCFPSKYTSWQKKTPFSTEIFRLFPKNNKFTASWFSFPADQKCFFVVSASIRGPSVMKCFPTDQKISRKKKKYSKRCVAPILKQKEALPSRTCSFFRSFERHVTYSNCGGEKETKFFSGNVPRAPSIIIEHYRPEVDKASWQGNFINESLNEGSQRSCRPFRGQLPTARFCVSTITHFKEKNGKKCGDLRNSDSTFSPAFVARRLGGQGRSLTNSKTTQN